MSGSQGCLINEPARKPIAQPIPMPRLARREKSSVIRFIPYWSVIITAVVATAAAVIWVIDTIEPPGDPVRMRTIEPCVLADITGRMHSSSDWREADAVVLFLIGLNDKASPQFAPEMRRLAGRFDSQGVLFFGLAVDPGVTQESAASRSAQLGLSFPTLLDPSQELAGELDSCYLGEATVLDGQGHVLYQGPIDDRATLSASPRCRVLESAILSALDGESTIARELDAGGPLTEPKPILSP